MNSKVAWITGASGGIGSTIAERLAADGYAVALGCHWAQDAARTLAKRLSERGVPTLVCPCDLSDSVKVNACAEKIVQTLGEVTLLVNNAGIAQQKLFQDMTDEEWGRLFAVNVHGAFYAARAVLPAMIRAGHGGVINITSMWGQVGASCEVGYSATKAALIGMTRALAKEVAPSGIRVNAVAPGVIDTAMMAGFDADTRRELADQTPLGRLGTPQDVAEAVAFLASDRAAFITGQILGVNGGFVI